MASAYVIEHLKNFQVQANIRKSLISLKDHNTPFTRSVNRRSNRHLDPATMKGQKKRRKELPLDKGLRKEHLRIYQAQEITQKSLIS